ncbi:MAG: DoxX family protein [Acidobacteria bacterium]|nr:DoxX family protein [Acidobacteriota bacterium]
MTDSTQELPQPDPQPQEGAASELRFRNSIPDWTIRAIICLIFLYFGTSKFKNDAKATWVVFFEQVGLGQWLRYLTGALETVGAFMVLVSGTVEIGLAMIMIVTLGATVISVSLMHDAPGAFVPFALFCGMIAFWLHRRRV